MDGTTMPADMTLYFDVIKQIQDQINRITYANQLNEQERLNLLNRLEHDISQKFYWARRILEMRSTDFPANNKLVETASGDSQTEPATEMDVA